MKVKVKGLVFAGLAAVIFAGNAHAALQAGDLDPTVNPTHVTAKSYVDRVVNSTAGTLNDLTTTQKGNLVAAINEVNTTANNAGSAAINTLDYSGNNEAGVVTNVTQTDGVIAATKAKITNTEVADNAAIAQSKIDGLTDALAAKATNAFVGTLPAGAQATTVTGYIDEAVAAAASDASDAIADLDLTEVGGNGNVVMTVSQADGQVSATAGKIANANVADNAAIAQSKIDGLTDALAAKATNAFVGTLPAGAQATTVTGYIDEAVAAAASDASDAIADLDLTEVGGNGNVVMTVSQADGQVSATAGKIANANVADNAAIAQSKIDGLTDALAAKATNAFVGTLPAGAQATTVTGYIDEAAQNAGTAAVENLDYTGASGTGVIKQVTQADGTISATKSPVTNEDIASNAAIAQSKIANLTSGCSEQAPCAWINNVWVPIQQ